MNHLVTSKVPDHLEACQDGVTKELASRLAELLNRYQAVFSQNDQDVGKNDLVQHSAPVQKGTRPIRQPPHRLGPQKEQKADHQIQDLLVKGMIKPASVAWWPGGIGAKKESILVLLRRLLQAE